MLIDTVHCKLYNLGHQSVVPPGDGTGWTLRGQVRVRTTSESCFPPGIFKDLHEWVTEVSKGCPTLSKFSAAVAYPLGFRTDIQLVLLQGVGMLGVGAIVTVSVYYITTRKPKQHIGALESS